MLANVPSPSPGSAETDPRPMAAVNPVKTTMAPAAMAAPDRIAGQSMMLRGGVASGVMLMSDQPCVGRASAKAKEGQDEQDDDHQADNIDDGIHGLSPLLIMRQEWVFPNGVMAITRAGNPGSLKAAFVRKVGAAASPGPWRSGRRVRIPR